jgi:hypothetical protein
MQRLMILIAALIGFGAQPGHAETPFNYTPPNGDVPDEATAVKIAEAVLTPIYGRKVVETERPFHATLKGEVWSVSGTLHCSTGKSNDCLGGVAEIDIAKRDGRVLRVSHGL